MTWNVSLNLPHYEYRCKLINLDLLEVRRKVSEATLTADLLTSRINCTSLLWTSISAVEFCAPTTFFAYHARVHFQARWVGLFSIPQIKSVFLQLCPVTASNKDFFQKFNKVIKIILVTREILPGISLKTRSVVS